MSHSAKVLLLIAPRMFKQMFLFLPPPSLLFQVGSSLLLALSLVVSFTELALSVFWSVGPNYHFFLKTEQLLANVFLF